MFRQWLTLVIIVLVYIPVAIDATVLHVAAPTLSMTLGASGNELLWIIDIYSLVMAGMVLPMGALGTPADAGRDALWPGVTGGGVFAYRQLAYRHQGITGYWRGDDCTGDAGRDTRHLL